MSFRFKKKKKSIKPNNNQIGEQAKRESKLDVLARIEDLKLIQKTHFLKKNYQLSIQLAKDIIDLAHSADIVTIVKEQEELIKKLAQEVDINKKVEEIKKNYVSLYRLYDKLVAENQVEIAHGMVEKFVKKYEDFPEFNFMPEIQQLTMKDAKVWINFLTERRIKKAEGRREMIFKSEGRNLKAEIKENCNLTNLFFNKLIAEGNVEKAHRLVEEFVRKYDSFPVFSTISEVREIIDADARIWINFLTEGQR